VIEDTTTAGEATTEFMKESRQIGKKGEVTLSVDVPLAETAGGGSGGGGGGGGGANSGLFEGRGLGVVRKRSF